MSIDERARLVLYQRLAEVLGTPEADTMMSYLPPQGWGEIATKGDLALLRADFDSLRRELHAELAVVRAELRTEIAAVRSDLSAEIASVRLEIAAVRSDLSGEIAAVRSDLSGEIAAVRSDLSGEIAAVRSDIAEIRTEMHRSLRGVVLSLVAVMVALAAGQMAMLAALV
jgi:ribosomal protein L29